MRILKLLLVGTGTIWGDSCLNMRFQDIKKEGCMEDTTFYLKVNDSTVKKIK